MSNQFPKIEDSDYKDIFASTSYLPDSNRSNFEIRDLEISVVFNARTREAEWVKEYTLEKVRNNHQNNDQWWEVTGCPEGKFLYARRDPSYGYADEGYLDKKGNILYRIDMRENFPVGTKTKLIVSFITRNHEAEDKLLEMEKAAYFRKYLFRYDFGYSVPIDKFTMKVSVINGSIKAAWPKILSQVLNNTVAIYNKTDGLRAREIFTPLIQIEHGNKSLATIYEMRGAVLIGLITSLVGGIAVFYFSTYIAAKGIAP